MGKIICERCGKTVSSSGGDVHNCIDKEGKAYDYCPECWGEHTTDEGDITNLIIS